MKSSTALFVMTLAVMGSGSAAFAQEHRSRSQKEDAPRAEQRDRRSAQNNSHRQIQRAEPPRQLPYGAQPGDKGGAAYEKQSRHGHAPVRHGQVVRGHGPVHGPVYESHGARGPQFRTGMAIPVHYRSYNYVVNNWHAHHLHAPRRGQHWVQVGADYVLVAIATGIIVQLVLSN